MFNLSTYMQTRTSLTFGYIVTKSVENCVIGHVRLRLRQFFAVQGAEIPPSVYRWRLKSCSITTNEA